MSRLEEYGFDIEREMKRLKNIVEKDDSLTISSRFVKYLIQQAERVEELENDKGVLEIAIAHVHLPKIERYKQILKEIANAGENIDDLYYYQEKSKELLEGEE